MSWEKSRDAWLDDRIQDKVDKEDVFQWISKDPVWRKADKITVSESGGSHQVIIYVKRMGLCLPGWKGDLLNVSDSGGRYIKRWLVKELVKGYKQLEDL